MKNSFFVIFVRKCIIIFRKCEQLSQLWLQPKPEFVLQKLTRQELFSPEINIVTQEYIIYIGS